jgi:hypothetical protein
MATQQAQATGMPMPLAGAILVGIAGALLTGTSFWFITIWPLPVSVEPMMDFQGGLVWGGVVGAICGLVLGFIVDEKHFEE